MGWFDDSCRICVPPKRHPGCHDSCPDYARDKAKFEARKQVVKRSNEAESSLAAQRERGIIKAQKRNRHKWKIR